MLAEQYDEWTGARRYLGLDVLVRCHIRSVTQTATSDNEEVTIPALTA
ncbi:hypothetical protein SAMN05660657_03072 [Geodermatophilus amargosae]|uniref:Transposase, Mutator family n=1 Tax=Geodermatophilus amargosae TaxID=1296565 RepID=A0A1I7AVV5_9ACTN|nr:hypothetical protein SAMN05660657_03072 [Geodermatophilus amargosae]